MNIIYNTKSSDVKKMQDRLLTLGYKLPGFGADSHFGSETRQAIIKFQTNNNIPVTGSVDDRTYSAIFASTAKRDIASVSTEIKKSIFEKYPQVKKYMPYAFIGISVLGGLYLMKKRK